MTKRILLYSDCDFFAGCENMMAVIMNNSDKLKDLKVEFTYRYSRTYETGLSSRLKSREGVHALNLLNLSGFFIGENSFIRRNLRRVMHIVRVLCLPFIFFDNIIKQYNFLKQKKVDVLFLNNGGYPGALSTRTIAIVGRFVGIKKIYMVVNNTAIPYRSIFRFLGYPLDKMVVKCVDMFITGSDNAGKALNEVLGIKKEQRKVIYNCIETKRFNEYIKENREFDPNNEKIIFTNIGLLEKRKGQIVLLNAVQHLLTLRPELRGKLHFNIEGEGREKQTLIDYITANKLQDVVSLLGSTANIGAVYNTCDVFVLPSISNEDLPNVISEAMMFSKPIIACEMAGVPHQVEDGINGYLVKPGCKIELVEAIESCFDNMTSLKQMGENSKNTFLEKFSVEAALVNYQKLFS